MALSKIQLGQLLAVYGKLLTEKQREALSLYCDCDCTLSEIADENGISRQGVRDAVKKAEATFEKLEEALRLADFYKQITAAIQQNDDEKIVAVTKKFVG